MVSATVSLGLSPLNPISCSDKSFAFSLTNAYQFETFFFLMLSLGVPKITVFCEGVFRQCCLSVAYIQPVYWGPTWSALSSLGDKATGELTSGCPSIGVYLKRSGSLGCNFDTSVTPTWRIRTLTCLLRDVFSLFFKVAKKSSVAWLAYSPSPLFICVIWD